MPLEEKLQSVQYRDPEPSRFAHGFKKNRKWNLSCLSGPGSLGWPFRLIENLRVIYIVTSGALVGAAVGASVGAQPSVHQYKQGCKGVESTNAVGGASAMGGRGATGVQGGGGEAVEDTEAEYDVNRV